MATNKDEVIDLAISPISLDPRPATPGPGIFVRDSLAAGTAGPPAGDNYKEKPNFDANSSAPEPQHPSGHHRFLTPTEWARVAHGLGAIHPDDNGETHQVVHPTSWLWPPKGLPDGLYCDIVTQRSKYSIGYTILSALHWIFLILQIAVGASLTALGSSGLASHIFAEKDPRDAPITILAAVSTVVAGLLALMHNSGLPERYRKDMNEFDRIKNHVRVSSVAGSMLMVFCF